MAEILRMPKLGFDMAEGILVRWLVAEGEKVEKGQVLAEIETDKATVEVEALQGGVIHKHLIAEGAIAPVGEPIAVVAEPGEEPDLAALIAEPAATEPPRPSAAQTEAQPIAPTPAPVAPEGRLPDGVRASPLARRMAREHDVPLSTLHGSGPGGRIIKRDIEQALQRGPATPAAAAPVESPPGEPRPSESLPLSKLRGAIGRRMTTAKQQVPHFYVTSELDAAPLMDLRSELNALLPTEEKLSVNDFIIKAAANTLRAFPNLNASLDQDHIVRHGQINIGVAVAVEQGLLTVVVRDADRKPLRLISQEVQTMAERARQGRVRPEDIEGSTFTVSNLGMFDVDHFIAIINPPEAAILAIGSVRQVPVLEEGRVVAGRRVQCTLSADHRVTDGAEAARWLQAFKAALETPLTLLV